MTYSAGVARPICADAEIVLQMHYTTIGEAASDRTSVGLIFQDEQPQMEFGGGSVMNIQFVIPPGAADHEVRAERTFKEDTYLFNMSCRSWYTCPSASTGFVTKAIAIGLCQFPRLRSSVPFDRISLKSSTSVCSSYPITTDSW